MNVGELICIDKSLHNYRCEKVAVCRKKKLTPSVHEKSTAPECRLMTSTQAHVQKEDIRMKSTHIVHTTIATTFYDEVGVVSGDVWM